MKSNLVLSIEHLMLNNFQPGAVTNMIDTLQWDSLACRWCKATLILLYKINGDLVEVPKPYYPSLTDVLVGHIHVHVNNTDKDFYKFSFFSNAISVWNSLPQSIALSPNLKSFKVNCPCTYKCTCSTHSYGTLHTILSLVLYLEEEEELARITFVKIWGVIISIFTYFTF